MSEQTPPDAAYAAAREQSIEEMADLLQDEFASVARAAGRLCETSDVAKKLDEAALLKILAQLRLGRAMDDFTTIYLDIKDQEAEAAANLLDELEEGSAVMRPLARQLGNLDDGEDAEAEMLYGADRVQSGTTKAELCCSRRTLPESTDGVVASPLKQVRPGWGQRKTRGQLMESWSPVPEETIPTA